MSKPKPPRDVVQHPVFDTVRLNRNAVETLQINMRSLRRGDWGVLCEAMEKLIRGQSFSDRTVVLRHMSAPNDKWLTLEIHR